jgi:non-heme chloroperoxidase
MRKRDKGKKIKRRLGAASALLSTMAVVAPVVVRKLDHKRDGQARSLESVDLDFEHHHIQSADGTSIHVTVTGQGDKTVFLIHGWTCTEAIFRFQQEALAGRYKVVTMELRGHGDSSLSKKRDYRTETMAEDLKAVIDFFDPAEFAAVGFSMGGYTILKFCQRFGEEYYDRLKGIILFDSSGMCGIDSLSFSKLVKPFYPFPIGIYFKIVSYPNKLFDAIRDLLGKMPGAYLLIRALAYGDKPCGAYVEIQREMSFSTSVSVIFLALKAIFDYQVEEYLPNIPVPVLQLVGEKDRLTSVEANRCTAELLPNATVKVFPGAGHNVLLERWQEYNADITAFLEKSFA